MARAKRVLGVTSTALTLAISALSINASAVDPAQAAGVATTTIMAYPTDQIMSQDEIGDTMTMSLVQGTVTKNADGTYDVAPTRSSVPARVVSSAQVVDFYVQVLETDGTVSETAFSLVEDPTSGDGWIDGGWAIEATRAREQLERGVRRSPALRKVRSHGSPSVTVRMFNHPATSDDRSALRGRWTELVNASAIQPTHGVASQRTGGGAADCDLYASDPVSTTVATSYPTQGDNSWLTYSSSEHTTTGIAVTTGTAGNFHASGTTSTDDEWGEDFNPRAINRSYRIDINYGLYHCTNVITGYRWNQVAPRYQPGFTDINELDKSDRPDWNDHDFCGNVANGNWWRGHVRGSDYSLSYGVKISSAIGIDLSSRHVYSSGTRLYYGVTGGNKRICGNNAEPSKAAKMIERIR